MAKIRRRRVVFALASHLCIRSAHFFRSIGLDIINFAHRQLLLSPAEPKYVVMSRSLRIALSRCCIHILPLAVSLFLISINLKGFYIGQHLLGTHSNSQTDSVVLALIQVAAKIQVSESI